MLVVCVLRFGVHGRCGELVEGYQGYDALYMGYRRNRLQEPPKGSPNPPTPPPPCTTCLNVSFSL